MNGKSRPATDHQISADIGVAVRRGPVSDSAASAYLEALEELAFGLVAVTSRAIEDVAAVGGLTFQQWRVLVVLGTNEEGSRVSELAARLGASRPSASRLVHRLAGRGLVEARPDQLDGRAVRVRLSTNGESLRSRIVARRRALIWETIAAGPTSVQAATEMAAAARRFTRWI